MQIRVRETGAVMYESEFRAYIKSTSGASWNRTTDEVLEELGADVVFEGPQAIGGEYWQFSQRDGVEQVDGKWYTKYILGPVFATQAEQDTYVAQKTAERAVNLKNAVVQLTQTRLDDFAKTRNYDGILSLCSYAASTNTKFQAEGQYGVASRDNTWAKLYEILAEVETGTRPVPTGYAEIEPELPVLAWPN
jgi:hypothetical protein